MIWRPPWIRQCADGIRPAALGGYEVAKPLAQGRLLRGRTGFLLATVPVFAVISAALIENVRAGENGVAGITQRVGLVVIILSEAPTSATSIRRGGPSEFARGRL